MQSRTATPISFLIIHSLHEIAPTVPLPASKAGVADNGIAVQANPKGSGSYSVLKEMVDDVQKLGK
jgi:hypothetical protein